MEWTTIVLVVAVCILVTFLWQLAANRERRDASNAHMWSVAAEACTEQRQKQLSYTDLPSYDVLKARAHETDAIRQQREQRIIDHVMERVNKIERNSEWN